MIRSDSRATKASFDWEAAKLRTSNIRREATSEELADILDARARELATPRLARGRADARAHLRFHVGAARFAVALDEIETVVRPPFVTRIPCGPAHVDRVFHHGSSVVAIVDLRRLLGLEERDATSERKARAVLALAGEARGLAIEPTQIDGVVDLTLESLEQRGGERDLVAGIADGVTLVVSVRALVEQMRPRKSNPTEKESKR
jgi:chemotaxis signal transduction protein